MTTEKEEQYWQEFLNGIKYKGIKASLLSMIEKTEQEQKEDFEHLSEQLKQE